MRDNNAEFDYIAEALANAIFKNKRDRQSSRDKRQKMAHDEIELYFIAQEIGCDRELLK
jgi:hypothetical protein